ncbi:lytic polysaccharide monooxygenase [Pantoea sp. B65]|uniref:lytic polysaccharide monooxygenase n=1 Tax=Pantoea sp. B65 TaxID=2813359 RepID=UPI0039B69F55
MKTLCYTSVLLLFTGALPLNAAAHGAVSYPISRQYQCYKDGGYWGESVDTIPNAGCRASFLVSHAYPFTQWHEISANPSPNDQQAAIERAVPNGLLCAAGDPKKRGLDRPQSEGWKTTTIYPGPLELTWDLMAPHNPSRAIVYITKDNTFQNRELRWSDLREIYRGVMPNPRQRNAPQRYIIPLEIPNITGRAIIYSLWQREDTGNEVFFNCSDVIVKGDDEAGNPTQPAEPGEEWNEEQPFIKYGITPKAGEHVRFRILGGPGGMELVDLNIPVSAQNADDYRWAEELARELNQSHSDVVMIGVKQHGQIQYEPTLALVHTNLVWVKDSAYTSALSIFTDEKPSQPQPGVPGDKVWPEGIGSYETGETVVKGLDGQRWRCRPFPQGGWCNINHPAYAPGGAHMATSAAAQAWEPVK